MKLYRSLSKLIFSGLVLTISLNLMANESELWKEQVSDLKSIFSQNEHSYKLKFDEDDLKDVYGELDKWGPDRASSLWKIPVWFRDAYLHDDSFRGVVRANVLPSFLESCYSTVTGDSLSCPVDSMVRSAEMGLEILRNVHKLPYVQYSKGLAGICQTYGWNDVAKSIFTLISHGAALSADLLNQVGDPYSAAFAGLVCRPVSVLFSGATMYFAMDGEYVDVALRSLKRLYEKQNKNQQLAIVEHMIAHRKANYNSKKID